MKKSRGIVGYLALLGTLLVIAVLLNGERVIISRSYVKDIKRRLGIQ